LRMHGDAEPASERSDEQREHGAATAPARLAGKTDGRSGGTAHQR